MIEYPKYKKVLFCTDFSENADHAFEFAYGIAKRDEGLLYILHVIHDHPKQKSLKYLISSDTLENIHKGLEKQLDNDYTEHYVNKIGNGVTFEIVTRSGREDKEIIKFAKQEKVDLIVMGTPGRTRIEHVFFGSVAKRIFQHSPSPVFIIPCKEKLECS